MSSKVLKYACKWNFKNNIGRITFFFGNNQRIRYEVDSAQELAAITDLLRNEKPVFLNINDGTIGTGLEPVGEEEIT